MTQFYERAFRKKTPRQSYNAYQNLIPTVNIIGPTRLVRSISPQQISSFIPSQNSYLPHQHFPFQIINTIVLPNSKNKAKRCEEKCSCQKQNNFQEDKQNSKIQPQINQPKNYLSQVRLARVNSQNGNFRLPVGKIHRNTNNQCFNKNQRSSYKFTQEDRDQDQVKNVKKRNKIRLLVECCEDCYDNLYKAQSSRVQKQAYQKEQKLKSVWDKERQIIQLKVQEDKKQRFNQDLESIIKNQVRRQLMDSVKENQNSQLDTNQKSISAQYNARNDIFTLREKTKKNNGQQPNHKHKASEEVHVNKFLSNDNYAQTAQYSVAQRSQSIVYYPEEPLGQLLLNQNEYLFESKQNIKCLQQKINALKRENQKIWNSMK